MVKLLGPIASLSASGDVGKTLIFSNSGGQAYARSWAKPANPNTNGQRCTRAIVAFVSQIWNQISPAYKASWDALAARTSISPFNACVAYNLKRWRRFAYPTITLDPSSPQLNGFGNVFTGTQHDRVITFETNSGTRRQTVARPIHEATLVGENATKLNLLRITPYPPAPTDNAVWTHRPKPGTYWYLARLLQEDGSIVGQAQIGPYTFT